MPTRLLEGERTDDGLVLRYRPKYDGDFVPIEVAITGDLDKSIERICAAQTVSEACSKACGRTACGAAIIFNGPPAEVYNATAVCYEEYCSMDA